VCQADNCFQTKANIITHSLKELICDTSVYKEWQTVEFGLFNWIYSLIKVASDTDSYREHNCTLCVQKAKHGIPDIWRRKLKIQFNRHIMMTGKWSHTQFTKHCGPITELNCNYVFQPIRSAAKLPFRLFNLIVQVNVQSRHWLDIFNVCCNDQWFIE